MDIISFSALLNIIWYITTIIFILHRYTTFFNRVYYVYKIAYKIKDGCVWLKNKIWGHSDPYTSYLPINTDEVNYYVPQSEEVKVTIDQNDSKLFSQFVNKNDNNNKYKGGESNLLLEIDMLLPFAKKEIPEEIPLMESHYTDAKSNVENEKKNWISKNP
jgi:hypothetical protein